MAKWAIFDIDGTLSDCSARVFIAQERRWDDFHAAAHTDPVHEAEAQILRLWHASGNPVALFTGRTEPYRALTKAWLLKHKVPWDLLMMRHETDRRPSTVAKQEMLCDLQRAMAPEDSIAFVMEDQDKLVAMWREFGITCLQPRPGAF